MRRVVIKPRFQQQPDGSWTAWYPDHDWSVHAATKADSIELLKAEEAARKQDPAYREWLQARLLDPPSSWLVDDVEETVYEKRMNDALSTDPEGESE
jgi:hypothetical protein